LEAWRLSKDKTPLPNFRASELPNFRRYRRYPTSQLPSFPTSAVIAVTRVAIKPEKKYNMP